MAHRKGSKMKKKRKFFDLPQNLLLLPVVLRLFTFSVAGIVHIAKKDQEREKSAIMAVLADFGDGCAAIAKKHGLHKFIPYSYSM